MKSIYKMKRYHRLLSLQYRSCHSICIHGNGVLAIFMPMFYMHPKIILLMGIVICEYIGGSKDQGDSLVPFQPVDPCTHKGCFWATIAAAPIGWLMGTLPLRPEVIPKLRKQPPPTLPYCYSQSGLPAAGFLLPAARPHCLKWGFRATLMGFLLPSRLGVASLQLPIQQSEPVSWGHPSFTHVQPSGALLEMEFVHSLSTRSWFQWNNTLETFTSHNNNAGSLMLEN